MEKIIIWKTSNEKYYYKIYKGTYKTYHVGDVNQYDHKVVLVVDLSYFLSYKPHKHKFVVDYKKMLINDIIRFLEKIK